MRVALFSSGQGSHLRTIKMAKASGLNIEPVFFFTNKLRAPCYQEAIKIFPNISATAFSHTRFSRPTFDFLVKQELDRYNVELVLFLGYMRVVTPVFLHQAPPIINIHPSLLPAFKGAKAIEQALEYGCKITGCTAHYVTDELDGGPIIYQQSVRIEEGMGYTRLKSMVYYAEANTLIKAIKIHMGIR